MRGNVHEARPGMDDRERRERFELAIQPHLDAAYSLARWLTRDDDDAQDVVQEACLRAFKFLRGLRGEGGRAWLLAIVRTCFYNWRQQSRLRRKGIPLEDESLAVTDETSSPVHELMREADRELVREALETLPEEYREAIVLRELENLSYKEIASVMELPLGTVMSRLARARSRLRAILCERLGEGPGHAV
jgi:RNA polymerase sigma factor (sigma-70 family)